MGKPEWWDFVLVFPSVPDSLFLLQIRQRRAKGCVNEQGMDAEPKWWPTEAHCALAVPKNVVFGKHPPPLFLYIYIKIYIYKIYIYIPPPPRNRWSAQSLFFCTGQPEGSCPANKQTCTILLQLISEVRTKSLAICVGVIKQRNPAGGGAAGCSGRTGGDSCWFSCPGHNVALANGLRMWKGQLSPRVLSHPSKLSEPCCGLAPSWADGDEHVQGRCRIKAIRWLTSEAAGAK